MKTMCGKNFKERMILEKFLYFKVETGHFKASYPFRSFAVISTKNIVRTFRHLDLKDKHRDHSGEYPVRYWENIGTAGPEIKQSDWLMLVIGPRTVLVV